jgi:hypothetical protein|tara:strand:- start:10106 stop:10792 length:687 start_codon:yes stop_codon:yes gene_type:complete
MVDLAEDNVMLIKKHWFVILAECITEQLIRMKEIKVIDVPPNMGISGENVYAPKQDKGYEIVNKNGKTYVIPYTTYCPICSDIMEKGYDGKLKRKFHILEHDLNFKLKYNEDTEGNLYATCDSCGFDLRKDVDNQHNSIKKEEIERIKRSIYVNNVKFSHGNYYLNYQDFIDFARSWNEGNSIELIISYKVMTQEYKYKLNEECLKDVSNFHKSEGKLGIPRKFWERL